MIRHFFRHLGESIKNLKRNLLSTLTAVFSVMIVLSLLGVFGSVILNTQKLASDIEKNIQVNVYLQPDSADTSETVKELSGQIVANKDYHKIYNALTKIKGVDKVTFSSKEEQKKQLIETMGSSFETATGDANPLSDVYIVQTKSPDDVSRVAKEAKAIQGVDNANFGGSDTEILMSTMKRVQFWGIIATALLTIVAVLLISNTIRITIMSRATEIQIMRLVGAKNSYIRRPYLMEGAWIGGLGAIIPSGLIYLLYHMVYSTLNPDFVKGGISMYDADWFVYAVIGTLFAVGIIIGSIGSRMAMRRYLKY